MSLKIVPITQRAAFAHVARYHRHHRPPRGSILQLAVARGDLIVGVAVVGRPLARQLQDGRTAEVLRCCTDGSRNACSMLYGGAWRALRALGYGRCVTYTLPSEGGASLRAAGWIDMGAAGGGSWSSKDRVRTDERNTTIKTRWQVTVSGYTPGEAMPSIPVDESSLVRQVSLLAL